MQCSGADKQGLTDHNQWTTASASVGGEVSAAFSAAFSAAVSAAVSATVSAIGVRQQSANSTAL